ncbi:hypothetical protein NEOLEDRAFT_564226 [Neolentinus lepideus HHB14362 ss-1]|uniref:Uncharacterized protein n=1 Tax=Neolentinus lepideus HHB14362 ss-1 TaxID=1314782 RepID=A0A165R2P8_9AGAM|nr:hypothetical protein NEOLEDRAFT_564226 [Neolentinus lepideus HHB14362 ss-1]
MEALGTVKSQALLQLESCAPPADLSSSRCQCFKRSSCGAHIPDIGLSHCCVPHNFRAIRISTQLGLELLLHSSDALHIDSVSRVSCSLDLISALVVRRTQNDHEYTKAQNAMVQDAGAALRGLTWYTDTIHYYWYTNNVGSNCPLWAFVSPCIALCFVFL